MWRTLIPALLVPTLATAAGTERRLHPQQVEASSFLWNDWNRFQENYHPLYAADDDPKTAWVEGNAGSGAGEWIRLRVTDMDGATRVRLKIRAGYQKSPTLFVANARPHEVTVKLLPGGAEAKGVLEDALGWQELVVEQPAGRLEAVQLRIGSVYEGTKYKDLCISDIQVFVTADTRDNPAFEKSKLQKILAWKGERVQAAQLFKQEAARELTILPAYRFESKEGPGEDPWEKCKGMDQLCLTRASLARAKADAAFARKWGAALAVAEKAIVDTKSLVPAQIVPNDKRPVPAVDGLKVPELYSIFEQDWGGGGMELPILGTLASLRAEQLGTFEVKEKVAFEDALKARAPGCRSERGAFHAWVIKERTADGRDLLRAMTLVRCARVEVREGHENLAMLQVAVYDGSGHLALVAGPGYVNGFEWSDKPQRPLLVAGRGVILAGGTTELSGPEVAKTP